MSHLALISHSFERTTQSQTKLPLCLGLFLFKKKRGGGESTGLRWNHLSPEQQPQTELQLLLLSGMEFLVSTDEVVLPETFFSFANNLFVLFHFCKSHPFYTAPWRTLLFTRWCAAQFMSCWIKLNGKQNYSVEFYILSVPNSPRFLWSFCLLLGQSFYFDNCIFMTFCCWQLLYIYSSCGVYNQLLQCLSPHSLTCQILLNF